MSNITELKARLDFWWAKKTVIDGRDFDLSIDEVGAIVTILRGKFKGAQFRFSPLTVREDDEAVVDFQTHVVYYPEGVDLSDPKFGKLATNILRILILSAVREQREYSPPPTLPSENEWKSYEEYNEVLTDANRNTDTSEPTQERGVHEKDAALLEKRVSKRKSRAKTVRSDKPVHSEVQQPAKPKRTRARTTGAKRPK